MKSRSLLLVTLASLVVVSTLQARIIRVPQDQPAIQTAIDASVDGDTVLVAPGVYSENLKLKGKGILLASHFLINGDPGTIETTIIDGSQPADADTGSCVLIINGEDTTTVVEGFTLTGGSGTVWRDEHGAGNFTEGGAFLIQAASPIIRHNIMINNQATRRPAGTVSAGGGAIRCGDGNPRILNNLIIGNTGRYGAGIVLNFSGAVIRNNVIAQNSGGEDFGGGGLWVLASGPAPKIIENNTIVDNSSTLNGGGVLAWSTPLTLRNNIIWGNTAPTGSQIHQRQGAVVTARFCDVQGGWSNGNGNIDLDPLFSGTLYLLYATSPAIDAGDSSVAFNDPGDPTRPGQARWPAQGTLRNDMGAYGGPGAEVLANTLTGIDDPTPDNRPAGFFLAQNYPNPFNPQTTIRFYLPASPVQNVRLEVFDILGQRVKLLLNGADHSALATGLNELTWNATDDSGKTVASGVYFYRLEASLAGGRRFADLRRMLFLK